MTERGGDVDPDAPPATEIGREMVDGSEGLGSVLAHLYRGEVERAVAWRDRLDNTTNWAVTVMAAIVAYGFAGEVSHAVILAGMLIANAFLYIEARRFRYYDIWRSRVRTMQENLFATALDPSRGVEHDEWRTLLSEDYRDPRARLTYLEALRSRLRRVYLPLLTAMLLGWLFHLLAFAPGEPFLDRAALPGIPGVVVAAIVGLYFLVLLVLAVPPSSDGTGEIGEVDHGEFESDE